MQTVHYAQHHYAPPPPPFHPMTAYSHYPPTSIPDPRLPPPIPVSHVGPSNKRLAPPHPHPGEAPAKKKQSKWTADEDRSIIELRGNGMKWEDISKHLPGRSAISCRLRFQNYLERRSEWDEEKKNKLARLYERFKKDMWEKISKEMQLPWRAAEAMHWQIGEVEMAQRANVPVFHLAGQHGPERSQEPESRSSLSPCARTVQPPSAMAYSHTHNHSLPQIPHSISHPVSPVQTRLRRSSDDTSPPGHAALRRRADSARSMPISSTPHNRTPLPPLVDVTGPPAAPPRYTLPPVVTDSGRR
ncbi:Transcription factor MYB98 [Lecanosticta acicola]|uniref:Transcription factor MYB98 n=1 Tax=Lecanosticta acicola TaxID=111012 RepID=A0AAI9EE22_9PEZI|nr:Transcription factor MYB98 [Lecanosticta acicola]